MEILNYVLLTWLLPVGVVTAGFFRLFTHRALPLPPWIESLLPLRGKWLQRCWAALFAFVIALMLVPVAYTCRNPGGCAPRFLWEIFLPNW